MKMIVLFFLFVIVSSDATAHDGIRPLEAAEIAGRAFEKKVRERGNDDVPYARLRNNIENYNVGISFDKDHYFVYFSPKFEGFDVEGGAATYVLRKSDLAIVKVIPHR